ncbi:hypothetical protein LPU83_3750 [Rhizobium favelukesii]|uniref:Uncharacterized protein n=1 Tax=Rhizobium favelukesii TaxID=348824 RepID=W6RKG8_9HYPH|nr:hypothetical protein LPU83_3750 [Rhizobium favelukesii]
MTRRTVQIRPPKRTNSPHKPGFLGTTALSDRSGTIAATSSPSRLFHKAAHVVVFPKKSKRIPGFSGASDTGLRRAIEACHPRSS